MSSYLAPGGSDQHMLNPRDLSGPDDVDEEDQSEWWADPPGFHDHHSYDGI